jgi:biotin carboxyl carrier protein
MTTAAVEGTAFPVNSPATPLHQVEQRPLWLSTASVHYATVSDLTPATITRWLKSVGDAVGDGELPLELATDKVDTEIPAPATGILTELLESADSVVADGMTTADEVVALDRVLAAAR